MISLGASTLGWPRLFLCSGWPFLLCSCCHSHENTVISWGVLHLLTQISCDVERHVVRFNMAAGYKRFKVDTDATLSDAALRQVPAFEFFFVTHGCPDASKRGNSGGAGTFTCPPANLIPWISASPANMELQLLFAPAYLCTSSSALWRTASESSLKLAEGLTQQRQSAFSSFVSGCPGVSPGSPTTFFYRLVDEPPFLTVKVYHHLQSEPPSLNGGWFPRKC